MKKVLKWLMYLVFLVVIIIAGGAVYLKTAFPKDGPVVDVTINKNDTALMARGKYLANAVCGCVDCHSPRYFQYFGVPYNADSTGAGGLQFNHDMGFPGTFYSKNITPFNIGKWSDAQFYHTVTTGVTPEGTVLFPVMIYPYMALADPEDVKAIIAYIRTLKSVSSKTPDHDVDFPVNLFYRMGPHPATPMKRPAPSDTFAYGKYMFTLGACQECHTPRGSHGDLQLADSAMAGGQVFTLPGFGKVRSSNLTPDAKTGLGGWTKEMFIQAFKCYDNPAAERIPWKQKGYQTLMPWLAYCKMTRQDLGAIYTYLRTFKPVNHSVTKWTAENGSVALGQ